MTSSAPFRGRAAAVRLLLPAAFLAAALGLPAFAQDDAAPAPAEPAPAAEAPAEPVPADPARVVITIDGEAVTEADLAAAAQDFGEDLAQVPDEQRRQALVDAVVDMHLMAKAATAAGLDQSEDFNRRMAHLRLRALRNEYFSATIDGSVTDDMVRARYDEEVAKLQAPEEVRARHILVESEAEATAIIAELNGGADFAALAKERSTDPGSAENGGDLGFFTRGRMIPEFEEAAFALQPGELGQAPVHSQFGWHVIKVEERRAQPPPPYEVVAGQLRRLLLQEAYVKAVGDLRAAATIVVDEPVPAPAPEAAPDAPAPADGAAPAPAGEEAAPQ